MARVAAVEYLFDGRSDLDHRVANLANFFRIRFECLEPHRGSADRERCSFARRFVRAVFALANGASVIGAGGAAGVRYCAE